MGTDKTRVMLGRAPIHEISSSESGSADSPRGESVDCRAG